MVELNGLADGSPNNMQFTAIQPFPSRQISIYSAQYVQVLRYFQVLNASAQVVGIGCLPSSGDITESLLFKFSASTLIADFCWYCSTTLTSCYFAFKMARVVGKN